MNTGQRLGGPRRRQRIAAISAIHVALSMRLASSLRLRLLQPGSTKIRHRCFNRLLWRRLRKRRSLDVLSKNKLTFAKFIKNLKIKSRVD